MRDHSARAANRAPAPQEHTGTGISPNDEFVNMNGPNAPGLGIELSLNKLKFLRRKFSHLQKDKNGFVYPRIVEGSLYIKVIFLQKNAYLSIRKKAFTKN